MEYKSVVQSSKPLLWSSKFNIKYLVSSEEYQADYDESWLFVASMDICVFNEVEHQPINIISMKVEQRRFGT